MMGPSKFFTLKKKNQCSLCCGSQCINTEYSLAEGTRNVTFFFNL